MPVLFASKNQTFYYRWDNSSDVIKFSRLLHEILHEHFDDNREIVFLCIGSDRSTGDSLGPIIGYKLKKLSLKNITVYGCLKSPVHAINLNETIELIYKNHLNPVIVAIDASLGSSEHIGSITLSLKPLKPGLGVKKSLPEIGDVSITGIVNLSGILDNMLLNSTRLCLVVNLADAITTGIFHALI